MRRKKTSDSAPLPEPPKLEGMKGPSPEVWAKMVERVREARRIKKERQWELLQDYASAMLTLELEMRYGSSDQAALEQWRRDRERARVEKLGLPPDTRIPAECLSERDAAAFFEKCRWRGTPKCTRCWSEEVERILAMNRRKVRDLWWCRTCQKQFTMRRGTVLERSSIPLRTWAFAFWLACTSGNVFTAAQIRRFTGLSMKSAQSLRRRVRDALKIGSAPRRPYSSWKQKVGYSLMRRM